MDLDLAAVSEINEKKLVALEGLPIIFCQIWCSAINKAKAGERVWGCRYKFLDNIPVAGIQKTEI